MPPCADATLRENAPAGAVDESPAVEIEAPTTTEASTTTEAALTETVPLETADTTLSTGG